MNHKLLLGSLIGSLLLAMPIWSLDERIEVGNVADLNLNFLRDLIQNVEKGQPPVPEGDTITLTLEQALEVTLKNNFDLQIQTLARDSLIPEIAAQEAKFDPTSNASFGFGSDLTVDRSSGGERDRLNSYSPQVGLTQLLPTGGSIELSTSASHDTDQQGPNSWESRAGVIFNQPLLRGGRIFVARRDIQDAKYNLEIENAVLRATILDITAKTKTAYYLAQLSKRIILATEQSIERDQELVESSTALFKAGRGGRRDVVSAQLQLSDDLARLAEQTGDLQLSQNTLRDVLGLPISTQVVLAENNLNFEPIPLKVEEWIQLAMQYRPELMEISTELKKSDLDVRVKENALLPTLNLRGSFDAFSQSGTTRFNDAWDLDQQAVTAGLEFEFPLGNVAAKSSLSTARLNRDRVQKRYENQQRQIELLVREAAIVLDTRMQLIKPLTDAVEQAREKHEVATVRFKLGLANNLDITDSQTELLDAEISLLDAIAQYAIALAELEARIGSTI
ncbi:TolC family protein [Myxococcota bacterium]|nr:TolC family protein [Myxococcota bacterium]